MTIADLTISDLVAALAKRQPSPGGGAAAAVAAALGCSAGAMAARYTDGPKHAAVAESAANLATVLDAAASECLRLAEADAQAYAAVRTAKASKDATQIAQAEANAAAVPANLLAACALHASSLAAFTGDCNRWLISDVHVGIHLLAGAGRAAWRTLLVNQPTDAICAVARTHLNALDQAEASLE